MIKKKSSVPSYIIALLVTLIIHLIILIFVKKESALNWASMQSRQDRFFKKLKLDKIELINQKDLEEIKRVGVKGGKKNLQNPDMIGHNQTIIPGPNLSLENLGYNSPPIPQAPVGKKANGGTTTKQLTGNDLAPAPLLDNDQKGIYFNYKKQKVIPPSREHNNIKSEVVKNLGVNKLNTKASNISNFDIRIERPEGVSEDQLNSDEKAFYSFYRRTYMNYVSNLFSTYEKIRIEKPGLDRDFEDKHLLIGRIDYDENGDIVTIKILKSSDSDNVHYFFEEALKRLKIPNPPKIFIKKQKQFSVYYQIHIN